MRLVHEYCLVEWIRLKDSTKCELCQSDIKIVYKLPSFFVSLKKLFQFLHSEKKNYIIILLYGAFIYLFTKRLSTTIYNLC